MVAVKAHQAESFLKALDRRYTAFLFYGSDTGLIAERARSVAAALAAQSDPPGEITRIEDADLELDPERLAVELLTIPMFGGRKVVLARAGRRLTAQALKPILAQGTAAASLVVEAGNLKPDDALRLLFEKSPGAAAVACYADEARDIESIAAAAAREAGLEITPRAMSVLVSRLGADRALSRGEIDKLLLYARGKGVIDVDEVDAVVGDASELALEKVVLATASGFADSALTEYDRVIASGESPQAIITAVQRHFLRLHRYRAAMESGRSLDELLRQARPPIHFKLRPQLEAQCRSWALSALSEALALIGTAAKSARLSPWLEGSIAERLLLDLATLTPARKGKPR